MKTNVAVFFGGRSTEHEISVISASQAINAFDETNYNIIPIYITKQGRWYTGEALLDLKNYRDVQSLVKKCEEVYFRPVYGDNNLYFYNAKGIFGKKMIYSAIDVVVPVLHGANGEDGTFQGLMEAIGMPYAGCNILASANGMDKITMKMILESSGIPVVDYIWFTDKNWFDSTDDIIEKIENKLGYPVIVKPANLGSSVGIGRAANRESLKEKVDEAAKYSQRIIVEHMIVNLKEINCSVLGDCNDYKMSVLEEPVKSGEILSYTDKYLGGGKGSKGMQSAQKRIPADLPEETTARIQFLAGETFRVLSCEGVSRIDFIIDDSNGKIYVNEINTIPGSLSYYLWEATGIKFSELMDRLVTLALKRRREEGSKIVSYDQNIFNLSAGNGVKGAKGGIKGIK